MSSERDRSDRFERLFAAHYCAVFAYARRRAPSHVAQDVVAETFLVAWRRFDELHEEQLPWLYGVARRVLANELRSARRRDALVKRAAGASATCESADVGSPLREALDRIGERDRELLLLMAWEGLSPAAAAVALGCSRGAVRVRLHRARKRLAAALELGDEPLRPVTTTVGVER